MEKATQSLQLHGTECVIEALTNANMRHGTSLQQKAFREALHALVKLAKAEKLLEMRMDTAKAIGLPLGTGINYNVRS